MVAVEVANMLHFWDEVNAVPAPYIFIYMKNIQFTRSCDLGGMCIVSDDDFPSFHRFVSQICCTFTVPGKSVSTDMNRTQHLPVCSALE